jgi:anhydro-N-acetylmuramic acid kinase
MAPAETTTEEIAKLNADLGEAFAKAACRAIDEASRSRRPTLIGLAGQTVCHLPGNKRGRTVTMQLGEAARVAARTRVVTVSDFRQSDVAAGGQGAPLVPWTDWVLFRSPRTARCIQNIGGIGNVTWLPAGAGADDVVAFDTGPGNMIIDAMVAHATAGRQHMDRDGRRAAKGRVIHEVLAEWMRQTFFNKKPPKTTGREDFGRAFAENAVKQVKKHTTATNDWIATATALTARTIARSYKRFLPGFDVSNKQDVSKTAREVIVAGGGANNPTLLAMLAAELPGVTIKPMSAIGIPVQSKECVSFAMLAAACVDRVPANLTQATGATRPAVLGRVITP